MKLHLSVGAIVLTLGIGAAGIAWGVEQGAIPADNAPAATAPGAANAPAPRARQQIAHDRTIASATRAYDTGAAASAALCSGDRGLQNRTHQAADAAQRELNTAAQAEADFDAEVSKAHIAALSAGLQSDGDVNGMMDEYEKLRASVAREIADSALQLVATPTPASTVCPPAPSAPPQRSASTAPPPMIPSLPATPGKSIGLLNGFDDQMFKATLAQPGLRLRVETLMGLEGCNWSVNGALARGATSRQAATFINRMNDDDLRDTLTNNVIQDRLEATVRSRGCVRPGPDFNPVTPFPQPNTANQDPGPQPYPPYGYPGGDPYRGNSRGPYGSYGGYGGYGGYGQGYIP